jgi:hypothetical protein
MMLSGFMTRRSFTILCGCVLAVALSTKVDAQIDRVHTLMDGLKAQTEKLGGPKVDGSDTIAGRTVPVLYFGNTKANNNNEIVDAAVKEHGGTATLFVKSSADYVRVATNVQNSDGSRAIGTTLDPNGPVIKKIDNGQAYYGDASILGKEYVTGYDPIKDGAGNVIGIYYVGYPKSQ